jgi:4-amino-4-deoxy-L-arabinose transferase-like glycosyltransferase
MVSGTEAEPPSLPRLSWPAWGILAAYATLLFTAALGSGRLLNARECYVAVGAAEMLATGDWRVPRLGGRPWLEKPPLPHWAVAALSWFAGVNAWTARLPAAAAGVAGVLVVASLAAQWYGPARGLLTGLIQAATVYTLNYARLATSDIYLWAIVVGLIGCYARVWVAPRAPGVLRDRLAFFVLLGLTFLVKGPLFGAVLGLLPCIGYAAGLRDRAAWGWFWWWPGWVVMALVALPWPLAILLDPANAEAADLWWLHTFGRFNPHGRLGSNPWYYYLTTFAWQAAPWTPLALVVGVTAARRAWADPRSPDRLLWLWLALPFAALSAVAGKHPQYLIYALPPLSFWAAEGVERLWGPCRRWARAAVRGGGLTAVAALLLGAGAGWWAYGSPPTLTWATACFGTLMLAGGAALGWWASQGRAVAAAAALFATLGLAVVYTEAVIIPDHDGMRDEVALYRRLATHASGTEAVWVYLADRGPLLYYYPGPVASLDTPEHLAGKAGPWLVLTFANWADDLRRIGKATVVDQTPPDPRSPLTHLVVVRLLPDPKPLSE